MFRKILLAALAALTMGAVSLGASTSAEARWYGGGASIYRHGGWGYGGWGHHGYWGGGWGHRGYWGGGWGGGYPLFGPSFYVGPSYDYYDDEPVCRIRTVRVHTYYGWRWARQRVCW